MGDPIHGSGPVRQPTEIVPKTVEFSRSETGKVKGRLYSHHPYTMKLEGAEKAVTVYKQSTSESMQLIEKKLIFNPKKYQSIQISVNDALINVYVKIKDLPKVFDFTEKLTPEEEVPAQEAGYSATTTLEREAEIDTSASVDELVGEVRAELSSSSSSLVEEEGNVSSGSEPELHEKVDDFGREFIKKLRSTPRLAQSISTGNAEASGLISKAKDNLTTYNPERQLLMYADEEGKIHITEWSNLLEPSKEEGLLGKGAFGVAQKLKIISEENIGKHVVIKAALPMKQAQADVQNEAQVLLRVHSDGILEGIQLPPHAILALDPPIFDKTGQKMIGYIQPLYAGDMVKYDSLQNHTREQGMEMIRQLLSGGASLEVLRIVAGDIKPANIFYNKASDEEGGEKIGEKYYIADLGGAREIPLEVTDDTDLSLDPAHTKPFVCWNDVTAYTPLSANKRKEALAALAKPQEEAGAEVATRGRGRARGARKPAELIENPERLRRYAELENKRDAYALGASLIIKLGLPPSKSTPVIFEMTGFGYSKGVFSEEGKKAMEAINEKYGTEVADFLMSMVDPDYTKRPTRQEAYNNFMQLLET